MDNLEPTKLPELKVKQKKDRKNDTYPVYNGVLALLVTYYNVSIEFYVKNIKRRKRFFQSALYVTKMTIQHINSVSVVTFEWVRNKKGVPNIKAPVKMFFNNHLHYLPDNIPPLFHNYLVEIMKWFPIQPGQPKSRHREVTNPNTNHQKNKWNFKAIREIKVNDTTVFTDDQLMFLGQITENYVRENNLTELTPYDYAFVEMIRYQCEQKSENTSTMCHFPESD